MDKLSDKTSPQVPIEPQDGHLQIDGDRVKAHAEVVCQVAEGIQYPSWPHSTRIYTMRQSF